MYCWICCNNIKNITDLICLVFTLSSVDQTLCTELVKPIDFLAKILNISIFLCRCSWASFERLCSLERKRMRGHAWKTTSGLPSFSKAGLCVPPINPSKVIDNKGCFRQQWMHSCDCTFLPHGSLTWRFLHYFVQKSNSDHCQHIEMQTLQWQREESVFEWCKEIKGMLSRNLIIYSLF